MKPSRLFVLWLVVIVVLLAYACGSEEESNNQGDTLCSQASDCGPREAWVCEEGVCYNRAEFCREDAECNGSCSDHKCSESKIQTVSTFCINICSKIMECTDSADWPAACMDDCAAFADYIQNLDEVWECMSVLECDTYSDIENSRQVLNKGCSPAYPEGYDPDAPDGDGAECEYECCADEDCSPNFICDADQHACVYSPNCQYDCCEDTDCQDDPDFGAAYICKFHECYNPSDPCLWDCCSDDDCGYNEACLMGECTEKEVLCSPGEKKCCSADPQHPDCVELDELAAEAYLVCNSLGNLWQVESCTEFNDCVSSPPDDVECVPNGRCETDENCSEPLTCQQGEDGKHCSLPTLNDGDECWDGTRYLGNCPDAYFCCPITSGNPGYCVAESCD